MAETFEAYRTRVLSYLGDEEPIGVQQATPSQLDRRLRDGRYGDSMERMMYNTVLGAKPLRDNGETFYYSDYNFDARRV